MIKEKIPVTELLAGLAEEASELAQAALKYRRTLDGTNPTPMKQDEAYENLCEEVADVRLYMHVLSLVNSYTTTIMGKKMNRWETRLQGSNVQKGELRNG